MDSKRFVILLAFIILLSPIIEMNTTESYNYASPNRLIDFVNSIDPNKPVDISLKSKNDTVIVWNDHDDWKTWTFNDAYRFWLDQVKYSGVPS